MLVSEVILMKKKNMNEWFKGKGFYISLMAGAICVVAIGALTLDSFGINKNMSGEKDKNDIAKNIVESPEEYKMDEFAKIDEDITKYPEANQTNAPQKKSEEAAVKENEQSDKMKEEKTQNVAENKQTETKGKTDKDIKTKNNTSKKTVDNSETDVKEQEQEKVTVMNAGKDISSLTFDQEAGISWPVNGEVIMKYSADNVVYHATLGQYKSNPGLVISAGEGSNVSCSADGVVTKVGENEEIGEYIETSIGDEYKITYGGLENIQVKKGDTINKGEILGIVAPPTKYYIDEGANVYMKMTCKNEPVDPMIFLE